MHCKKKRCSKELSKKVSDFWKRFQMHSTSGKHNAKFHETCKGSSRVSRGRTFFLRNFFKFRTAKKRFRRKTRNLHSFVLNTMVEGEGEFEELAIIAISTLLKGLIRWLNIVVCSSNRWGWSDNHVKQYSSCSYILNYSTEKQNGEWTRLPYFSDIYIVTIFYEEYVNWMSFVQIFHLFVINL